MLTKEQTLEAIASGQCNHWRECELKGVKLRDGHQDAVRGFERKGKIDACYPWLLADIFSIPATKKKK